MEYVYAALLLNETGEELNEENITAVLEAAGCDVVESRTKALVAGLEGVDVDRIGDAATGGGGPAAPADPDSAGADGQEDALPVADDAGGASDAGRGADDDPAGRDDPSDGDQPAGG